MPFFKSTYNILKKPDEDEVFNPNWMNSDKLILPPNKEWSYDRSMKLEDVDIWEVLWEGWGCYGVYAAWEPYAEFYMITVGFDYKNPPTFINGFMYYDKIAELYYGPGAQQKVIERVKELKLPPLVMQNHWVEPEDMWLYQSPK